jgi:[glutamine synthetase] adenylyltransferase / [glutamine synthetase]-adenylyl-L-tyrosine phosphorylase
VTPACARSPWLAELARREPDWFAPEALAAETLRWPAAPPADEAAAMVLLRREVLRERVRIAVRDLEARVDVETTLRELSQLAEQACACALSVAMAALQPLHGQPRDAEGRPVSPVLLGMGKLGGGELNFSSDIDLIFTYTAAGESDGAQPLDNGAYFARVVQRFTRLLAERTAEGFVYRVDWMLRPFGSAGAPAASFAAMEDYYQVHGREWERYALIKARPVAGDVEAGRTLLRTLRPFVYRRYLDFNAVNNLRDLKRLIEEEVARKGLDDNIKLGAGGIREIEFIVQSFQLMRGGQDARLRQPALRPTLRYLGDSGMLALEVARQLEQDYDRLRRLENAIQMQADAQTHEFPRETEALQRLAPALGAVDAAALVADTQALRERVHRVFEAVFAERRVEDTPMLRLAALVFDGRIEREALTEMLADEGLNLAEALANDLLALAQDRRFRALGEASQARLRRLVGQMMQAARAVPEAGTALRRVLGIVAAITGRATYISLLHDSETARQQLLTLAAASPWLSDYLAQTPALLDQLLDPRSLYAPPAQAEIRHELATRVAELTPEDPEGLMNLLRRYQKEVSLRVAAADLVKALPLVKVSDRLTWLAEALIEVALEQTQRAMVAEYGEPRRSDGTPASLGVIGYGKLGGIEMGYGSDLDLVFIHDADDLQAETRGGTRRIDVSTWFARCAQRLINLLSAQTAAGRVYEVDLQLRPSGKSGLVVTSFRGYAHYQREEAWTWEHQALTRARYLCGPASLGAAFTALRSEVLQRPRAPEILAAEIREMRDRMRAELDRSTAERWDLKQGRGGLTDAEFLTQYWVLREAHRCPALLPWSDNWRQLDVLAAAGVIGSEDRDRLIEAYRELREAAHRLALQNAPPSVDASHHRAARETIDALWRRWLEEDAGSVTGTRASTL